MRYLVNLVQEVWMDVIYFLLILFYSTVALGLIAFVLHGKPNNMDYFFDSLTQAYQTNIGDYPGIDGYDMLFWLFFFLFTILNPIIMLNLIINLMGETFNRVQEGKIAADTLELIGMIIEAETLLFWRRNYGRKEFLQICMEDEDTEEKRSGSLKRIWRIKSLISDLNKKVDTNQTLMIERLQEILRMASNLR